MSGSGEYPYAFTLKDVPVSTTNRVREALAAGRSCQVLGAVGSGKTYAVRKAVNGAIWIDLDPGPLQLVRFLADVARQLDCEKVVRAVAEHDFEAARDQASIAIDNRTLVVDRADALCPSPDWAWGDPGEALWLGESSGLAEWLTRRAERNPVVLIRRRAGEWPGTTFQHVAPEDCPIWLKFSGSGYANWMQLAELAAKRPGGLVLGRAVLYLLGASAFNELLARVQAEKPDPSETLRVLGGVLRDHAPDEWQTVLALVEALDGAERTVVEKLLPEDIHPTVDALIDIGLVEERARRLTVLATAATSGATGGLPFERRTRLLRDAATKLRATVNSVQSLDPKDAQTILRAHALYVAAGDFENALETARFHVAGLVELAARTSLAERWEEARQQYESIWRMLETGTWPRGEHTWRLRSYVLHYLAYNGRRARTVPDDVVHERYTRSIDLWPDNALWHKRLVALLAEMGCEQEASRAVSTAYSKVPEHPRRDGFLRVTPAWVAMRAGEPIFALVLVEPLIDRQHEMDPQTMASLNALLDRWSAGVRVSELDSASCQVVFKSDQEIHVWSESGAWRAQLPALGASGRGSTPTAALAEMARALATEIEQLVRSPSGRLDDESLRRKGVLIGSVDLVNSDVGLELAKHRWLLGRIDSSGRFEPLQSDFEPLTIAAEAVPPDRAGLYFARVPVLRDGHPSNAAELLEPAGSARPLADLVRELRQRGAREAGV